MFQDIACPTDKQKVNELYQRNEKGLAIIYMLRKIKPQWKKFMEKVKEETDRESRLDTIKINYWNGGLV